MKDCDSRVDVTWAQIHVSKTTSVQGFYEKAGISTQVLLVVSLY